MQQKHNIVIQPNNRKQNISAYNLKIENVVLTKANSCKFLGIIIDELELSSIIVKYPGPFLPLSKSNLRSRWTAYVPYIMH